MPQARRRLLSRILNALSGLVLLLAWPGLFAEDNPAGKQGQTAVTQLTLNIAGQPALGSPNAKLGIVEFFDFQCPYCRQFHLRVLPKIKQHFIDTGLAKFIYKDFPLHIHPQALNAAVVSNCAREQDKYWEMHHALLVQQNNLKPELYRKLAKNLGLDMEALRHCVKQPRQPREIAADMRAGYRIGVTGTPTFVIGRIRGDTLIVERIAKGTPSISNFKTELERLNSMSSVR